MDEQIQLSPAASRNIITRGLPKTGQVTQYQAGDDGQYEAGWWVGRLNANNRERWIVKTIGGDDVVFDRATGLMWAKDGNGVGGGEGETGGWAFSITYANDLDFAGFTDWRLPNIKELMSLFDYSIINPVIPEPPFANIQEIEYWSSTTYMANTLRAWYGDVDVGGADHEVKTQLAALLCVRDGL